MVQKRLALELNRRSEPLPEQECALAELKMLHPFQQTAQGEREDDEDDVYRVLMLTLVIVMYGVECNAVI